MTIRMITLSTMALLGIALHVQPVWGQGRNEVVVQPGQLAPGSDGTFTGLPSVPFINDLGQISFSANVNGTSGGGYSGIFRGSFGNLNEIVRTGQSAPSSGTFAGFGRPAINNSGQMSFSASLTGTSGGTDDNSGIFFYDNSGIIQLVRKGQLAPNADGAFLSFLNLELNDSGQTAFAANLTGTSNTSGIFRATGGNTTQIVRTGQLAPDANGSFSALMGSSLLINNLGQVSFRADLSGTSGGGNDNQGIFRGDGNSITQIARKGQLAPDSNGTFSAFGSATFGNLILGQSFNNLGQVAFSGILTGTSGGTSDNSGIFIGNGSSLTQVARTGQSIGNGTFSFVDNPVLNDSGQAGFVGTVNPTSGGPYTGFFRGSGGTITELVRTGQAAPDSNGTIQGVFANILALNNSGQAAFRCILEATSGGASDDQGIFTSDGIDFLQVVREGDALAGGIVSGVAVPGSSSTTNPGSSDWLNRHGQIAYRASLTDGRTVLGSWTPNLHWRTSSSGAWDNSSQWTLGLNPAFVHDVFIDPASNLTVTGPANNTTVRSLRVGGGTGSASFDLATGVVLTATNGVRVESNGTLTGNGSIIGNVVNHGTVAVTQGSSSIQGDVNNIGIIQINTGAQVTFLGNVTQNGTLWVAGSSSTAVFQGEFSGSGGFVGGGDVFVLGELRPGNSPASVLYDGNLSLGTNTNTFIELGGLNVGQFDQLRVTGDFNLAGELRVSLFDGHSLTLNQEYLIADIGGNLVGQFNGLGEGDLVGVFGGQALFISYTAGNGNDIALFAAIPEPCSTIVWALVSIIVASKRRRIDRLAEN